MRLPYNCSIKSRISWRVNLNRLFRSRLRSRFKEVKGRGSPTSRGKRGRRVLLAGFTTIRGQSQRRPDFDPFKFCLLYTSDAADETVYV
jgi:hypothetical protein